MKKLLCTLMAMLMLCQTFISTATIATAADEINDETPAAPTVPTTCAAGCENPDWQPYSAIGNINSLEAGHHHIYLDSSITPSQLQIKTAGVTLCLDLNGHNITTDGRSMIVYGDTTINVMDSSENANGYICGSRGNNNNAGGTISVQEGGTFNLYSGTLRFQWDTIGNQVLESAGIVWIIAGGTMNMYGGRVEGADMSENPDFQHSAAIFVNATTKKDAEGNEVVNKVGQLNVFGGYISAGILPDTDDAVANCVRVAKYAQLKLSGDARIDHIYLYPNSLTVDGTFSGDANLELHSCVPATNLKIGSAINTPAITGSIYCVNGDGWDVLVKDETLILYASAPFTKEAYCTHCKEPVLWKSITKSNYPQLKTVGINHFYLTENITPGQLQLPADCHTCLDLNGFGIKTNGRSAIVQTGATFNIMDSSEGETGYICGTRGNNNEKGGTFSVQNQAELNLYGGSLRFEMDDVGSVLIANAGVVWIQPGGIMNMLGGQVEGADFSLNEKFLYGAAIYVSASIKKDDAGNVIEEKRGQLNVSHGKITSGVLSEKGISDCVTVEDGAVMRLSGDAHIEEIYATKNALILDGTFSGEAWLNLYASTATDGMIVGDATNTPVITGTLFCINDDGWYIRVSEDQTHLILEPYSPYIENRYCQHCKKEVAFKAITKGNYVQAKKPGEHHFLLHEGDFTVGQILLQNTSSTCIDLNGHNINVVGRAFNIAGSCSLNLMDSSGTGKVISTSGINNCGGGVVFMNSGATFNLYGGTLELVTQYVAGRGVGAGGIVYLTGATMNMYGGTLNGADLVISEFPEMTLNGLGATVFMNHSSKLNVYGGQINSGTLPEKGLGECVYIQDAKSRITLADDAVVEDIYILTERDQLIVSGDYIGTAHLTYPESTTMGYHHVLGTSDNATIPNGAITCREYTVKVLGNKVVLDYAAAAAIINSTGIQFSDTLADAIPLSTDGYIMLLCSLNETVTADKDLYLDLNGFNLSGSITMDTGKTLYCMDRYTDDFTVEDGLGYGKLSATVSSTAIGVPADAPFTELPTLEGMDGFEGYAYLPIDENDGTSFHAVNLKLTAMTLRPETVGVYYKCAFAADEMVAPLVESYGVALSVQDVPDAENLETLCRYTTHTGFTPGGMDQDATSSLLTNIMRPGNANLVNVRNAKAPVYGRAYIRTENGYLFGAHSYRSLQTQIEMINDRWDKLTEPQKTAIQEMCAAYARIMRSWDIPNILPPQQEEAQ